MAGACRRAAQALADVVNRAYSSVKADAQGLTFDFASP